MYIKKLVLYNFKSFRGKVVVDNFDKGHIVVVGKNGAGKSNFLRAITFLINETGKKLKWHEKLHFLHGGRGKSAYVEVTLADCNPMLLGLEEVTIRRVLMFQSEAYYLNKKRVDCKVVIGLFELLGFSSTNIWHMEKMLFQGEQKRLAVMIQCIGASIYETVLVMKEIMEKFEVLKHQIDKYEETIRGEIFSEAVRKEKRNALIFEKLNSKKLFLQIILKQKLNEKLNVKRMQILADLRHVSHDENTLESFRQLCGEVKTIKDKLLQLKHQLTYLEGVRESMLKEESIVLSEEEKYSLIMKDLETLIKKALDEGNASEESVLTSLTGVTEKLVNIDKLYREEKNKWKNLNQTSIEEEVTQLTLKKESLLKCRNDLMAAKNKMEEALKELNGHSELQLQQVRVQIDLKSAIHSLQDELRELRSKEAAIVQSIEPVKKMISKKQLEFRKTLGSGVLLGIKSVEVVLRTWQERSEYNLVSGYRGLVINNFKCSVDLNIAIDLAAGERLFYHIVDSPYIGTQILKEMTRQNLPGIVSFLPLNTIRQFPRNIPRDSDAYDLLGKLEFNEEVKGAMEFVFRGTLICRNLEAAVRISRAYNFTCVTLSGEKVAGKGVMSGGFLAPQASLVSVYKALFDLEKEVEAKTSKLCEIRSQIIEQEELMNQKITLGHKMKLNQALDEKRVNRCHIKAEIAGFAKELEAADSAIQNVDLRLEEIASYKDSLSYQSQMEGMNETTLIARLQSIGKEVSELKKQIENSYRTVLELESEKCALELKEDRLTKLKEQQKTEGIAIKHMLVKRDHCIKELVRIRRRLKQLKENIKGFDESIKRTSELEERYSEESEKLSVLKSQLFAELMEADKANLKAKLHFYEKRIEENELWINSNRLKPNVAPLFEKFKFSTSHQVVKELKVVQGKIKELGEVNEKGHEYYNANMRLAQKMESCYDQFCLGYVVISSVGFWLEEHIEKTLEKVSNCFSEIFKYLEPEGSAGLVLEEDIHSTKNIFGDLSGMALFAQFPTHGEVWDPNILSGGQKAIILFSLLFAFNMVSPHPFYIIDEMDKALGPSERQAAMKLISTYAKDSQFVLSTHYPDLLSCGSNLLRVSFQKMASEVKKIAEHEARQFVESDSSSVLSGTSSRSSSSQLSSLLSSQLTSSISSQTSRSTEQSSL